jgi:IS605 OrfB family transposase
MTRRKLRTQIKTIRAYTVRLSDDELQELDKLFNNYGRCRDLLYGQLCGINHMTDVENWRGPRDRIRQHEGKIKQARKAVRSWKKAYAENKTQNMKVPDSGTVRLARQKLLNEQFHIQGRHVTEAVKEVCMNLNSMWTNLGLKLKKIVQANESLAKEERQYLNYVFTASYYWQLKLTGPFCYANKKKRGDVQLILDRDKKRLEVHRAIKAAVHDLHKSKKKKVGMDKGLATLLSCSSGHEYGFNFSQLVNAEAERINRRNTNRNEYIQAAKELRHELSALQAKLAIKHSAKTERRLRNRIGSLERRISRLEERHLGSKLYHRQHARKQCNMERIMNMSIRKMLLTEKPDVLVKEDLSFTKEKLPKAANRYEAKVRRKLSSWSKGTLDDRIEYLCDCLGIRTVDVNPAYTSQFCPNCGARFSERKGTHHELTVCPNCGEMNANTAAAVNILRRADDKNITLYTPYKKVEKILEDRYANKQSVMA